jgi:NAD(P)-dependent dehydrogenase (short-subunit alcohol dehydrogenase family)
MRTASQPLFPKDNILDISTVFSPTLFNGHTVFITGGGSGINLGIAKSFTQLGANLAICGRSKERLDRAATELRALGAEVVAEVADVRDADALKNAMAISHKAFGPIDTLVCGAAGNFTVPAEKLTPNGFKTVIDIDLIGSFNATHAAFEQLKESRGSITFVSAGQAFTPYAMQAHVGAAKAGIDNLMRNLAFEWGRYGIRSNSIAPGPIEDTEGMNRLGAGNGTAEKIKTMIPLGRFGRADEMGAAVAFLSSPLAAYITGTLLICDGGQNLPGTGEFSAMMEAQYHALQASGGGHHAGR